jgi:hypothetical protein
MMHGRAFRTMAIASSKLLWRHREMYAMTTDALRETPRAQ